MSDDLTNQDLIEKAQGGDERALAELFEGYRARLRRMVRVRLDRRLQGRVDASDILQEAYLKVARKIRTRPANGDTLPFYLWLRLETGECLIDAHRRHLQTAKRDAHQEVSLYGGPMPVTDSFSLAAQLLGKHTSPSQKLMRVEAQIQLEAVLNAMEPIDREILVLRHFEELSNQETAQVLGIERSASSSRYFRALARLKEALDGLAESQ